MTEKVRRLLTLDEAADRLRKSPAQMRWLRREWKRRGIKGAPTATIGGRIYFDADGLEDYIAAQFSESA